MATLPLAASADIGLLKHETQRVVQRLEHVTLSSYRASPAKVERWFVGATEGIVISC
jgi:hypothetical protein